MRELIRRRDFEKYGTCRSCNKPVSDWREFDAGHFISAGSGGFSLLFHERNINGECQYDIAFNGNHLLLYRRGLDARSEQLTGLKNDIETATSKAKLRKEWSQAVHKEKIEEIKEKLAVFEV
jgi:hypothetical protein